MVNPSTETVVNGKRSSSEIESEICDVHEADMKKQKIDNSSDLDMAASSTDKKSANELLKTRIKKYLEENRSLKYIDIQRMSENLHNNYPDYRRRKFKVFKDQVEYAFKSLTEDMGSKKKAKKKKTASEVSSKETIVEEIQIDDETTVKGSSMNSRLSSLYTNENKAKEENDICEVIDDEDEDENSTKSENLASEFSNPASEVRQVISNSEVANDLTDFEKCKAKVKELKDMSFNTVSSSGARKAPSKNLSSYINNVKALDSNEVAPPSPKNKDTSISHHLSDTVPSSPVRSVSSPVKKLSTKSTPSRKRVEAEEVSIDDDDITSAIKDQISSKKKADSSSSSLKKKKKVDVSVSSSSVTFADFGGNEGVLVNIAKLLVHLKHPEVYQKLGVTPPRGFLLHGPPGCGKTLLAHAIAGELQLPFIKVSAPEIVSGVSGDSEKKLRELFEQAVENSPCVLFIDEIDCITQKRENAGKEMERRIVAQLLTCLDELGEKPDCQVVVIGATNRADSLDPALRRAGRFDREIGLGIPDTGARQKILEVICRNLRLEAGTDMARLALLTPGYVGADLTSLTREAAMAAVNRVFGEIVTAGTGEDFVKMMSWIRDNGVVNDQELDRLFIEDQDWKTALKIVQPSAKREGFVTVPDVTWADVGALELVREELQLAILAPVNHKQQFDSLGLPQSSGVLLVGPPGCGKTLVAKAIANEAGINFISVKGPELINMYVGESERAVRSVFLRAKNSRPCVIFFDEVDSLAPRRNSSSGDGGSSSRVVNQLLTEMDGVEGREGVWIMAASNRPDILDPAVMRPGRLDKILYVGFPGPRDRVEILSAVTKGGSRPRLGLSVNMEQLGTDSRCDGFSGADVGNLVRQASMIALREVLRSGKISDSDIVLENRHFEKAFGLVKPSVGGRERERYEQMKKKYGVSQSILDDEAVIPESFNPVENSEPDVDVSMMVNANNETRETLSDADIETITDIVHDDSNLDAPEQLPVPRKVDPTIEENSSESQLLGFKDKRTDIEEDTIKEVDAVIEDDVEMSDDTVVNDGEVGSEDIEISEMKVDNSYEALITRPELRFLKGMEVRVSDKSLNESIAGDTGVVENTGVTGHDIFVLNTSTNMVSKVNVKDLEPSLPEEGDFVKSLLWDDHSDAATVVSIDDDDNAVIKLSDTEESKTCQIDKLCKVNPKYA